MRTVAVPALLAGIALVLAGVVSAACNDSTPLPPLLEDDGDASPPQACAPGNECNGFEYCIAGPSAGCKYLACIDGGWACPPEAGGPEAGTRADAGAGADAGADASGGADARADADAGASADAGADADADAGAVADASGDAADQ